MKKRMTIAIVLLVLVFGGIFGWKALQGYFIGQYFANFTPPPVTVSATEAAIESWQPRLEAVGSLRAVRGVDVPAEVAGVVETINFRSGDDVEAGDLLVQLDDSAEQAELPGLRARLQLAEQSLARAKNVVGQGLAAQESLDAAQSEFEQARSAVEARETTIAKKAVRAPFAGRLGIRQVDIGEYVQPGDPIVTLQALDTLLIDFMLPQRHLGNLEVGQPLVIHTDAWPDTPFEGRITAISPKVDPATRNFAIQGLIENPDGLLRPGMFAEIAVLAGEPQEFVTVPRHAVSYSLYGDSVYVVSEEDDALVARQRFIESGPVREGDIAILKGLEPGETIVTAGQLKLQNESRVVIDNDVDLTD